MLYKYLENCAGIYLIINKISGKVYIGSSENMRKRAIAHLSDLKAGTHHSKHLQKAWNKYGESSFLFKVLEKVKNLSIILNRENFWLSFYTSYNPIYGYNTCHIAGNTKGRKHLEITKFKISKNRKGKTSGINNPFYGKKHTSEFIEKLSEDRKLLYSKPENNPNYDSSLNIELIINLYNKGDKISKIARLLKVDRGKIERRLKWNGVLEVDHHSELTN